MRHKKERGSKGADFGITFMIYGFMAAPLSVMFIYILERETVTTVSKFVCLDHYSSRVEFNYAINIVC